MAMGPNANAVESLDLRTPGAHGGELTMEILILIRQLRAKGGEDAVKFDDTTTWTLPAVEHLSPFPEHLQLNMEGTKGLQGSFVVT